MKALRQSSPSSWVVWGAIILTGFSLALATCRIPRVSVRSRPDSVHGVIAMNLVSGIAFGWLFWRRSIEAAMLSHVTFHVTWLIGALVLRM